MIYLTIRIEQILLIFILFIIFILLNNLIIPNIKKNRVIKILTKISEENNYKINIGIKEKYDFLLENEDIRIFIKIVYIPSNSAITINSKNTWNLTYGRSSSNPGRGYRKQRYLNELISFLNYKVDTNNKKLILIYPDIDKIQRYLNESEIAIINYKDKIYDYKVMTIDEFEVHFKDL